ncbi:hypothetical protein KKH27_04785 [bacterium]|nr:hypothetical protein [bacterium]MBU1983551.1 hypothetical protein [bacterium]
MKTLWLTILLFLCSSAYALEPTLPLLAQIEPTRPIDVRNAQPRLMGLYEQGWEDGVPIGDSRSGKIGWFFAGFGNVPFMWLPWTVEPRRPPKPTIMAEEEYNSGYKAGYRAGWKNAHKTFYIAGTIVSSAAAAAIILASD